MKKFSFVFIFLTFLFFQTAICLAGSISFDGSANFNTSSGNALPSGNILIKLNGKEVKFCKDKLTLTLDGAQWQNYSKSGSIDKNVNYELESDSKMKFTINPDDDMLKNGYSFKVPVKGKITKNYNRINALLNYGYDDISEQSVSLAGCKNSKAYLSGSIKQHKKGDKIFQRGSSLLYNKLMIYVVGDDFERTRDKITVKLIGASWTDYDKEGYVKCDRISNGVKYTKTDANTIAIRISDYDPKMSLQSYTLELPLTGTITGGGDIKAVVDFGTNDVKPCTVVFAKCIDGELSLKSANSASPIDSCNSIGSITINDSSSQSFKKWTKFELSIDQLFNFVLLPKLQCTGKFEDKCKIEFDKSSNNKLIISLIDDVDSGKTGTITLISPIIKRSESSWKQFTQVKANLSAKGLEQYNSEIVIAEYKEGANTVLPIQLSTSNTNSWANKNSKPANLTISDSSNRTYNKGDKLIMTFDSDFHWFSKGALPSVSLNGKFENKCKFEYNYDNPYEAYIVFTADVSGNDGSIVISNFAIERDTDAAFKYVNITVSQESDPSNTAKIQICKFYSFTDFKLNETQSTTEAATETTTADLNGKSITFQTGNKTYKANGTEYELLSAPYIKDGYTMLPIRVIANTVGISDENISYDNGTAVFTLSDSRKLTVSAGNITYTIENDAYNCSTAPEVNDGTMFLPMRDLALAVGILEDNIIYNKETKEVTLILNENE